MMRYSFGPGDGKQRDVHAALGEMCKAVQQAIEKGDAEAVGEACWQLGEVSTLYSQLQRAISLRDNPANSKAHVNAARKVAANRAEDIQGHLYFREQPSLKVA